MTTPQRRSLWMKKRTPFWKTINIKKVEKLYNATYIGDFALKDKAGKWTDDPFAVFYNPNPDVSKGHSVLFGIVPSRGGVFFADASIVGEVEWTGVVAKNGEFLVSTYRHDYYESEDGTASIDGGQNYIKGRGLMVAVRIDAPTLARQLQEGSDKLLLPDDGREV